jgi:hypothetical protein
MSKYILAGEPIADYIKRGGKGSWLVKSQSDANKLQRHLGASAHRKGLIVKCKTLPAIHEEINAAPEVLYVLIAEIKEAQKPHETIITDPQPMGPTTIKP